MKSIDIKEGEHGVIRVFSVSRPAPAVAKALNETSPEAVGTDLLNHPVNPTDIEIFPLGDLGQLGLAHYLAEGYDISQHDMRPDRPRLDALDGYVLLLHSSIAAQNDVRLTPGPDLTLIASYAEPRADMSAAPLSSEAAAVQSGARDGQAPKRSHRGKFVVLTLLLILLFILVWTLS